jgi:hypothetical protein
VTLSHRTGHMWNRRDTSRCTVTSPCLRRGSSRRLSVRCPRGDERDEPTRARTAGWGAPEAPDRVGPPASWRSVRLSVSPDHEMPSWVSVIAMFNGPGDWLGTAFRLACKHRAPYVVIWRGPRITAVAVGAPRIPHETIICFDLDPSTTKDEAESVGRLAGGMGGTRWPWSQTPTRPPVVGCEWAGALTGPST